MWLSVFINGGIFMRYKGFIIQKDFANDIYRKDDEGIVKECGGYRCRIYSQNDENLQNLLAVVEFAYGHELTFDERCDVADSIMEYIEENREQLLKLENAENISDIPLCHRIEKARHGIRYE